MVDSPLRILQVNSVDSGGGAANVTRDLCNAYRQKGHESWMVTGSKLSLEPFIWELDHDPYRSGLPGWLAKVWKPFRKFEQVWPELRSLHRRTLLAVDHRRIKNRLMGIEDFEFPGTAHLLEYTPERPDVVQFHNLHGDYFDLQELETLSQQEIVILTLHDAWLLSGHCAHSFDCGRWKTGCGDCPDLTIPPPIRRDATAYNWQRKREIFSKSHLHIAAPSRWLMKKVENSMLMPAAVETRIIPHGVDLSVFQPVDKRLAKTAIGIQQETKVALFAGINIRQNLMKDYPTLRSAITLISKHLQGQNVVIIDLGEGAPTEHIDQTEIRFVPYQSDPKVVAGYYQASDVYIHSTRADTFPNAILESLACGTPAVATAVGGIPEQIDDGETGFLVSPGDAQAMAARMEQILNDDNLGQQMGWAAADKANRRFDLQHTADEYLKWFESIRVEIEERKRRK